MHNVQPNNFNPVVLQLPVQGADFELRMRINAELAEIREEIRICDRQEQNVGPVPELITDWYKEFHQFVRPPQRGEVMPNLKNAILLFKQQLENLLADSVDIEKPYPPRLFGELPPRIVRFMVAKCTDRNSILFSDRIDAAKPLPPNVVIIPENFEEQLRMIEALRAQRLQEQEQQLPGLQDLMLHLRQIEVRQAEDLAAIGDQFQARIAPLVQAIQELGVDIPRQEERLNAAVQRNQERLVVLQRDLVILDAERREVRQGIDDQRRADLDLQIATNRLEQSIEKKKEEQANSMLMTVGLIAVSSVVTWGISYYCYGVSINFMNPKYFASVGIVLGGSSQSK